MPPPTPAATLSTKLKVQLKLAITRLRMVQSRDASLTKSSHRTVANLLDANKPDSALIRVESIIRSDILTELHEILELYCELLLARFPLLDSSSPSSPGHNGGGGGAHGAAVCDPGLEEAVKSIIYAAPRTEIKELGVLRNLLAEKFGKEFVMKAAEGVAGGVSDKVVRRLSVEPPKEALVRGYLTEIARAYGVEWPKGKVAEDLGVEEIDLLVDTGEGSSGGGDGGGGGGDALEDLKFLDESPHPQSSSGKSDVKPRASLAARPGPSPPKTVDAKALPKTTQASKQAAPPPPPSADTGVPDLTELERRFAALKKLG